MSIGYGILMTLYKKRQLLITAFFIIKEIYSIYWQREKLIIKKNRLPSSSLTYYLTI